MTRDGLVDGYQKINVDNGGFAGDLDGGDWFGAGIASIGDLDGDGVVDLAVARPTTMTVTAMTSAPSGFSF